MTTRQTRRRTRILDAGGSQLALLIDRRATLCLEEIQSRTGETKTAIIERLLWLGADPKHDG
jgi:hypothetical protein